MTANSDPGEAEPPEPEAVTDNGPAEPAGPAERAGARSWVRRSGRDRRTRNRLELVEDERVIVLNDRRIPGSPAAIKYLAVAPAGVFVIDAKDVKGLVHTKRPGPVSALGPDELHVGRHNCTPMVGLVAQQVEAVREALRTKPWASDIPVHAMLCLTRAQWGIASPIEMGEVWIGWPRLVGPRVKGPVVMESPMVTEVSMILADQLPSTRA
jgi:hypothetical protein